MVDLKMKRHVTYDKHTIANNPVYAIINDNCAICRSQSQNNPSQQPIIGYLWQPSQQSINHISNLKRYAKSILTLCRTNKYRGNIAHKNRILLIT